MISADAVRVIDTVLVAVPHISTPFLEQFWPNLFATFAGVILALLVDRLVTRARTRAGRRTVLKAYRFAVSENQKRCDQILQRLTKTAFHPVDVGLFDVLAGRALDVVDDLPLLQRLNGFQYQLRHLDEKLDTYVVHAFKTPDSIYWVDRRDELQRTIHEDAGTLRATAGELVEELDRRLRGR